MTGSAWGFLEWLQRRQCDNLKDHGLGIRTAALPFFGDRSWDDKMLLRLVYIQASSMRAVDLAIQGARSSGFNCKVTGTIDDDERTKIIQRKTGPAIAPQCWATILRGIHKGDGCFVESIEAEQAVVWCIPRLDLSTSRRQGRVSTTDRLHNIPNTVRPHAPQGKRSEQRTFDPLEVARIHGPGSVTESNGEYTFRKQIFCGGLVRRLVEVSNLSPKVRFSYMLYRACSLAPQIPSARVEAYLMYYYGKALQLGDSVKIVDGEQSGGIGRIIDLSGDFATVQVAGADLTLDIHLRSLRRHLVIGDTVRVEVGVDQGKWGSVVEVYRDEVTIISPNATQEVRAPFMFPGLILTFA